DGGSPLRNPAEMRRQPAERHRAIVRLPSQLVLRQPLEQPPGGAHLVVVVRQQRVANCHAAILLCVLCLAGCRREPAKLPPLVPQVSGTLTLPGLAAPVRIVRDTWGVPHIYAASQGDLFFAQGFVQAQDRLFQMDLWRRSALGKLSEVLGPNFIERDAMTRRFQYRGDRVTEWASYGPDAKAIAEAFVRGINAWVALARE